MDYSQLSDFEINGMVASLTQRIGDHTQARNKTFIHEYADAGGFKNVCLGWKEFDPCNKAADAWPIIESNRISIRNRYEGDWKAENEWGESRFHVACNPLRAAMIVFLLMQDAKHA